MGGGTSVIPYLDPQWTPRWKAGRLSQQVHAMKRFNFKNKHVSNDFSTIDSLYTEGLYTLGFRHLWWLAIVMIALILAQLRFLCTSARQAFNTTLRVCIYICASALFIGLCMQVFLHAMMLRSIPAIVMHPQHNGEIRSYMRKVQTQTRHITYMLMQKYNGRAASRDKADVAIHMHRTVDPLIQAAERLMVNHLDPHHARVIFTPIAEMMLKYDWKIFMFFTVLWCVGLASVLILACYNQDFAAAILGVIWCAVMAFFLTVMTVALADICDDPRRSIYYLALPNEIAVVEQLAIEYEYERLCNDWFKQFKFRIDQFEKMFLYASFTLSTIAHQQVPDYHYLYLWDMSDMVRDVIIRDVVQLRNLLPPRCDYDFYMATARQPGQWQSPAFYSKTRRSTRATTTGTIWTEYIFTTLYTGPITQPPPFRSIWPAKQYYYTKKALGPTRLPNYDTTLRVVCDGDNNLKVMIAMITVVMVAGAVSAISFLSSVLYMKNTGTCPGAPCQKPINKPGVISRSAFNFKRRLQYWSGCQPRFENSMKGKRCKKNISCKCNEDYIDADNECPDVVPISCKKRKRIKCKARRVCRKRKKCTRRIKCYNRPKSFHRRCRRHRMTKPNSTSETNFTSLTCLRPRHGVSFMGDTEFMVYPVTIHNLNFKSKPGLTLSPVDTPPSINTPTTTSNYHISEQLPRRCPQSTIVKYNEFDSKTHRKHGKVNVSEKSRPNRSIFALKHEHATNSLCKNSLENITPKMSNWKSKSRSKYNSKSHSSLKELSRVYVLNPAYTKRKKSNPCKGGKECRSGATCAISSSSAVSIDSKSSKESEKSNYKKNKHKKNEILKEDLVGLSCSMSKPCKGVNPCTAAATCSGSVDIQKPCTKELPCPKNKPCPESEPCPGGSIAYIRPKKEPDPRLVPTRSKNKPCTMNFPCRSTRPCPEYEPCAGPIYGPNPTPCSIHIPCPGSIPKAGSRRKIVLPKKIPPLKKTKSTKRVCTLFKPCVGSKRCSAVSTCPGPIPSGPPACTKTRPCTATEYCPDKTPCPGSMPPGVCRPKRRAYAQVPKNKICSKVEPCESTEPCPVYSPCPGTPPDQIFKPCSDIDPCPGNIAIHGTDASDDSSTSLTTSSSSSSKSLKKSSSSTSKKSKSKKKAKKKKDKTSKRGKTYTVAMFSSAASTSAASRGSIHRKSSYGLKSNKRNRLWGSKKSSHKKSSHNKKTSNNKKNKPASKKRKNTCKRGKECRAGAACAIHTPSTVSINSKSSQESVKSDKKAKHKKNEIIKEDLVGLSCSMSKPCKGVNPCTAAATCSGSVDIQKPCTKELPCPKNKPCPESEPCPGGSIAYIRPKKEPDPRLVPTRPKNKPCTMNYPCRSTRPCPEYEPCAGPIYGPNPTPCSIHIPCPGSIPKAGSRRKIVLPKKIPPLKKTKSTKRVCTLFKPCVGSKRCSALSTCPGPIPSGPPACTKTRPCTETEYCPDKTPCPGSMPPGVCRPKRRAYAQVPKNKICSKVEPCESTEPCPVYSPCPGTPPDQIFKPCSDIDPCPGNIAVLGTESSDESLLSTSTSTTSSTSSKTSKSKSKKKSKSKESKQRRKQKKVKSSKKLKTSKHGKKYTTVVASSHSSVTTPSLGSLYKISAPSSKSKRCFRWDNVLEKSPFNSTTKSNRGWSMFKIFSTSKQFPVRSQVSDLTPDYNSKRAKLTPTKASIISLESIRLKTGKNNHPVKSKLSKSKYEKRSSRLGFNPSMICTPPELSYTSSKFSPSPKFKLGSGSSKSPIQYNKNQEYGSVSDKKRIRTVYLKLPPSLTPSQPVLIKIDDEGKVIAPTEFLEACRKAVDETRSDKDISRGSNVLSL